MASWMVHLRIADILLDQLPGLRPVEFIVGNLAPDSGVPNADWSSFSPSTKVSHFKSAGKKAGPEAFTQKYFRPEQIRSYSPPQYSFYLGYLTHLITDVLWSERIVHPSLDAFPELVAQGKDTAIWRFKEDWYDLDFKYLRDHPGFRAFSLYRGAEGFQNSYMEEFSEDAFDDRRRYITGFYLEGRDDLDREYPYLSEEAMDRFVKDAADSILQQLK